MGDASMLAVREQDVASCELYGPGGHLSLVRRRGDRTTVVTLVADAQPEAPIEVTLDEAQTRFLKEFLLWIGGGGEKETTMAHLVSGASRPPAQAQPSGARRHTWRGRVPPPRWRYVMGVWEGEPWRERPAGRRSQVDRPRGRFRGATDGPEAAVLVAAVETGAGAGTLTRGPLTAVRQVPLGTQPPASCGSSTATPSMCSSTAAACGCATSA
jgi:hypothetical protein